MTREQLVQILDFLPIAARRAELLDKIVAAQEEAGVESVSKFVEMLICDKSKTKSVALAAEQPDTVGPFLKEVYDSKYLFEDCYDPIMLRSFCAPHSGNRELRYDQLTEQQQRTIRLIDMKYNQWKKRNNWQ